MRRLGSASDDTIADSESEVNKKFSLKNDDVAGDVEDDTALYAQVQSDWGTLQHQSIKEAELPYTLKGARSQTAKGGLTASADTIPDSAGGVN